MIQTSTQLAWIQKIEYIGHSLMVLRFDRKDMDFQPGQYIYLGLPGMRDRREYSIYSSVKDDFLEVLIRRVNGGFISPLFAELTPGDQVVWEGPFGFFLKDAEKTMEPLLFLATGSGISPFRSFARSFPGANYDLIYGIPTLREAPSLDDFKKSRVTYCISRERGNHYSGRLTGYLKEKPLLSNSSCHICGNSNMIYEAHAILVEQGIDTQNIFAEIYF